MDAEDEAVLNLIAECEWGLSNPPGSSSQKEHVSGFHGPQGALLPPPRASGPAWRPAAQRASRKSCLSVPPVHEALPAAGGIVKGGRRVQLGALLALGRPSQ